LASAPEHNEHQTTPEMMTHPHNNLFLGLGLGLAIPLLAYALLVGVFGQMESYGWLSGEGFSPTFRQRTLALVALCLNVLPFNYFMKRRYARAMRGIAVVTVLLAFVWVIYFGKEIL
jgi:hypothetical protein